MTESRKIKVLDLLLWDENSRLPGNLSGKDQSTIIKAFLEDEKRNEVRVLAKVILKDLDLIPLEKVVIAPKDDKFIVYEGNRRVTAYKCLIDPTLAGEYQSEFYKLTDHAKISKDFEIECIITEDFQQANRYIELKHLNNNEKPWGQFERDNHSDRVKKSGGNADKSSIKRANIGKLVGETSLPDERKKMVLGPGYITNFYRIVDSAPGYKYFGLTVNDEGGIELKDKNDLLKKLEVFIETLLTSKPMSGQSWSRAYNTNDQKEDFLNNLGLTSTSRMDTEIKANKAANPSDKEDTQAANPSDKEDTQAANPSDKEDTKTKDPRVRPLFAYGQEKEFPTLIKLSSKRLLVSEKSKKINDVYKELQYITVKECPHAVSVLVRVLADITVNRFLELNGEHLNREGVLFMEGSKQKQELKLKMAHIADNYAPKDMRAIMIALNDALFMQSLNQVVHNIGYFATETQIRDFWKRFSVIFGFLVQGIIEKENDTNKN